MKIITDEENFCEIEFTYKNPIYKCTVDDEDGFETFGNEIIGYGEDKKRVSAYWANSGGGYVYDVTHNRGTSGDQIVWGIAAVSWHPCEGKLSKKIKKWLKWHEKKRNFL